MNLKYPWTADMIELLKATYADEVSHVIATRLGVSLGSVYTKARKLGLKKSPSFLISMARSNVFLTLGAKHRFAKGHETQFKKGFTPHNWKPIGTERVADGYLQRKMTDTGSALRDYVPVHHLVWREAGREIPKGHVLIFVDGNRRNFDINNLQIKSRADMMKRNTMHNYPKEISQAMLMRGVLNRRINKLLKEKA